MENRRPSSKYKVSIHSLPLAVIGLALIFLSGRAFVTPRGFAQTAFEQETQTPTLTQPLPETLEAVSSLYSFIDHLASAKGADDPSLVAVQSWKIEDIEQQVLYAHPAPTGETRLEYHLRLPPDSLLRFSLAMAPGCWDTEGDGVSFKVYIEDEKGAQQVFERYIDPKHDEGDRKWFAYQVDLAQYGDQEVSLIFVTGAGPEGDVRYDWAGWCNPELVSSAAGPTSTSTSTPLVTPTVSPAFTSMPTPTNTSTRTPALTETPTRTPRPITTTRTAALTTTPTATLTPVPATVISDLPLRLRGGPGLIYDIIGRLEEGAELKILARDRKGNWFQVRTEEGKEGWVAAEYVQTTAEISSLPVGAEPPTPTPNPVGGQIPPTPTQETTPVLESTPTSILTPLLEEVKVAIPTATPTSKPFPDPSLMPSGLKGKIAFLSDREKQAGAAYVMDPDGTNIMRLTDRSVYDLACELDTFSPDRSQRLFVYDGKRDKQGKKDIQIWVQNLADGWTWPLVNNSGIHVKQGDQPAFYVPGWDFDPAWSPDSTHIVYVSLTDGNEEIHVVNKDDRARPDRRLTTNAWEADRHPSYSPDGSQIVFWSNRGVGRKQIWIMNADGSEQDCLLCNSPYNDWDPVWVKW